MYRTRKGLIVANGPSSWRHGRGNGIKPRRAARDLLIVATSRRGYRGAARLRQARLLQLFFALLTTPRRTLRVHDEQELVSSFSYSNSRANERMARSRSSLSLRAPHPTVCVFSFPRPSFQPALVHLMNLPTYPLLLVLLPCPNGVLFFLPLSFSFVRLPRRGLPRLPILVPASSSSRRCLFLFNRLTDYRGSLET